MNKTYKDQAAYLFYKVLLRHCTLESYLDRDNYVQDVFDNHFDNCFYSKFLTKELIEIIRTESFKRQEYLTKQLTGLIQDSVEEMKEAINSFTDDERTEYLKDIISFNEALEEHTEATNKYNSKIHLSKTQISYLMSSDLFNKISVVVKVLKDYFKDDELAANVFMQLLTMIKKLGWSAIHDHDQKIDALDGLTEEQNKFIFDNLKFNDGIINGKLKDFWTIAQANNFELKDLAKTILDK
jgi:hypothetical protein